MPPPAVIIMAFAALAASAVSCSPFGDEAVLAAGHRQVDRLGELLPKQVDRRVDLAHIVGQKMRTDDDIVEIGPIRAKRSFVVGALVQIVPGDGIQLRLGRFGKVEDIYLFQQIVAQLAELLLLPSAAGTRPGIDRIRGELGVGSSRTSISHF